MSIAYGRRAILGVLAVALALPLPGATARGGEAEFAGAFAAAAPFYREATFYSRTGNTDVAGLSLDEFVTRWALIAGNFAGKPPPEYAADPKWGATLAEVLDRAETGLKALDAGDPQAAHEAIAPIRGIFADLRKRNGIVGWSDLVDELSAAMDGLMQYRRTVTDLKNPEILPGVRSQAERVVALFERCRREAAAEIAASPEFKRLMAGAAESADRMMRSLETGDLRLFRIGSGELRSTERLLYLQFG